MTKPNPDMDDVKHCPSDCIGWTQDYRDKRAEVAMRAHRAGAAEELSKTFAERAGQAYSEGDDETAKSLRNTARFLAEWAKNERSLQKKLEVTHGRFDG